MDGKLSDVPQQVLAEIVKLAQKHGRQGSSGGWKDFLNGHDKQLGSSLSDPSRRSRETLLSFLQTFTDKDSLKFVDNVLRVYSNQEVLKKVMERSSDNESPEQVDCGDIVAVQRLVRLTVEHPQYITNYAFPSYEKDWVVTKLKRKSILKNSAEMLAVDCEMVLCEDGTEGLVRVCVVDRNLRVKLDELVNPGKPVADYRSHITGVTGGDLDGVTFSLADVQKSISKLLSKGTILVGHSLSKDLHALRMDYQRVVDTSFMFKSQSGRTPSLNSLCKAVLGYELRKDGAPHNCLDDACAAMKIVLAKIEHGVDTYFPLIEEEVPEADMATLLIHNISTDVSSEELIRMFPKNSTIALELLKKGHKKYSMLAIFKNPEEANQAFENLIGSLEQDSAGRPQKRVMLRLKTGLTFIFCVRKMVNDSLGQPSMKKRPLLDEDDETVKRIKVDHCDEHLKEIERLKEELREKDSNQHDYVKEIEKLKQQLSSKEFEISTQDKVITKLKKELEEMKRNTRKGYRT